jgi:protein involved in polysaccharide export with SLBB domain
MKLIKALLIVVAVCCVAYLWGQTPLTAENAPPKPAQETVFVLGGVRQPTIVPYTPELTLGASIATAGGYSEFGQTPIFLIRDGAIFLKTTGKRMDTNPRSDDIPLKPKDVVYLGSIVKIQ